MSEMLTGPKKIVDGLTEVFRGLTQMCEGMAEQIELLEFTSEEAEDEDKKLLRRKILPQRRLRKNCPTSRMTLQMTCPLIWIPPKRRNPNSLL